MLRIIGIKEHLFLLLFLINKNRGIIYEQEGIPLTEIYFNKTEEIIQISTINTTFDKWAAILNEYEIFKLQTEVPLTSFFVPYFQETFVLLSRDFKLEQLNEVLATSILLIVAILLPLYIALAHLLYIIHRTNKTKYFSGLKDGFEGIINIGIFNKSLSVQTASIIFQISLFVVVCLIANEAASINYKYESMTYPISISAIQEPICLWESESKEIIKNRLNLEEVKYDVKSSIKGCLDSLSQGDHNYLLGTNLQIKFYFKQNSEENNKYPFKSMGLTGRQYMASLNMKPHLLPISEINSNQQDKFGALKFDTRTRGFVYAHSYIFYIGIGVVITFIFVISLYALFGEWRREQKYKKVIETDSKDDNSIILPSSNSKIEFINSGEPSGFIRNDNQSSGCSGSAFKYDDTEDFEKQNSEIQKISSSNLNYNSGDFMNLFKELKQQSISNNNNINIPRDFSKT